MAMVVLKSIMILHARTTNQRISLTWRPADENPCPFSCQSLPYFFANLCSIATP